MKVLVTGGAGFIGSNFIHYWLNNHPQDSIINFDKLTYAGNLENLKQIESNPNYVFIKGDICDPFAVNSALEGVDYIVHFAAESHVDRSIHDPSIFIKTNVLGTQVLLDAALKKNIKRFHHVSTDEVYGQLPLTANLKFNEETPYAPRSPYAASKAAADHLVKSYYYTFKLPITITNCGNNFGPYMFPEKLLPLAITNLLENKRVPLYGDGKYVRDWIYVEDHIKAIDLVLDRGKLGETYCVGGKTDNISNLEVIRKILKILAKSEQMIKFVKDRPGHDRKYALDWTKINKELGWKPLHDFEHDLVHTINWYRKNQTWWNNVKDHSYRLFYQKQYGKKL